MKTSHDSSLRQLVLATLVAGAAFAVNAQGASGGTAPTQDRAQAENHASPSRHDNARRAERRVERMQIRVAQHLAALKVRLQLTPAQQGAWDAFTQAAQPTPDEIGRMLQARAQLRSLTTPERIDRMRALRTERNAAMDKRFDAAKTFYAQLAPEQQKTFDATAMRLGGGGDGGGGKGRHARHHGMGMQHDNDGGGHGPGARQHHGGRDHGGDNDNDD